MTCLDWVKKALTLYAAWIVHFITGALGFVKKEILQEAR